MLKTMKLDKALGMLVENDFNDYIDGEECCVCLNKTVTKTDCKHYLCLECWTRLIKTTRQCTICRRRDIKVDYSEVDDNDDDDGSSQGELKRKVQNWGEKFI